MSSIVLVIIEFVVNCLLTAIIVDMDNSEQNPGRVYIFLSCHSTVKRMVFRARFFSFVQAIQANTSKYFTSFSSFNLRRSGNVASSQNAPYVIPEFTSNLRAFTFAELSAATGNFGKSIGEGGFGHVYKGIIQSLDNPCTDIHVAVKRGKRGKQEQRQWVTEVKVLGETKHPNLVELIGYCNENNGSESNSLLVYEYMPNGSLDNHLYSVTPPSWVTRLKIAKDAATGLTYLHDHKIIFRDLKPSNILLDRQMNAKLSDFGFARDVTPDGRSHVSTMVVGTKGYAAPEYVQTGRLTSSCDVWSYGIFLRELITGQRPLDRNTRENNPEFMRWVCCYAGPGLSNLEVDSRLYGSYSEKSKQKMFSIVDKCLVKNPKLRPTMREVLDMVNDAIALENQQPLNGGRT